MDPLELFNNLESNQPNLADESRKKIHQMLNVTKESWLLNGIFDYYLATDSARCIEILVCVREPHDKHLFDRLADSIKGQNKLHALTVLGHVLHKQPGWLYKITQHQLLKELLKLLKNETEILPLMSALLAIVVLLPMIPSLMGPFLQDIFDIFSRLAAWNSNPGRLAEEQLVHLQVALYALFLRLYGMYPCNFISYLRNHYHHADNRPVFAHTVRPMLSTVLVHPYLVTASKDSETEAVRWKKMGHHDVIVQCESFAVGTDRIGKEDTLIGCRPRSATDDSISSPFSIQPFRFPVLTPLTPTSTSEDDFWSPSVYFQQHSNSPPPLVEASAPTSIPQTPNSIVNVSTAIGASPPEAAIEATPETTPIKDMRSLRAPQVNSAVARALNSLGGPAPKWPNLPSGTSTPTTSQPSSPMRKDASPFKFPAEGSAFELKRQPVVVSQKIARVLEDRSLAAAVAAAASSAASTAPPTSPLRPIRPDPEAMSTDSTQEDQEVLEIVRRGEQMSRPMTRMQQCDSVIGEFQASHDDEYDDCEQEHGSPCTSGGLHMPNSHSLQAFATRVKRLRYYSQCAPEPTRAETRNGQDAPSMPPNAKVRRANSCPEMKKNYPNATEPTKGPLDESDELSGSNSTPVPALNGSATSTSTVGTQTLDLWPMPYEHLFLGIFPLMETNAEVRPSPAPSPAPYQHAENAHKMPVRFSPYEMLDKYIEQAAHVNDAPGGGDSIRHKVSKGLEMEMCSLREQLSLLHIQLHYERHRREVHAVRNRRLLGESRSNKALDEHNLALRDQLTLLQKEIENLHEQLDSKRQESADSEREIQKTLEYWQAQCLVNSEENAILKDRLDKVGNELSEQQRLHQETVDKCGKAEARLFQMESEMSVALAQARDSQRLAAELERSRTELLLAGELNQRYRERLSCVGGDAADKIEDERKLLTATYSEEVRSLTQQLEARNAQIDAYRIHVAELESAAKDYDETCASQKRMLKEVKDEYHEQLLSVGNKYETQRSINKFMEAKILELWQKIETLRAQQRRPTHHSPDTSSCHEAMVSASMTSHVPLSPHSSPPLSASLASSEGSMRAFLISSNSNQIDSKEIKNLQVFVNQEQKLSSDDTTPDGAPPSNSD